MRSSTVLALLLTVHFFALVSSALTHRQSRNLAQFSNIIKCAIPGSRPLLEFNNYGCYCGLGGSGTPVDELDKCCQIHDNCYDKAKHMNCIPVLQNPYTETYSYTCTDNNMISCDKNNSECDMHICNCDLNAALCFSRASYSKKHKNLNKDKHCQ